MPGRTNTYQPQEILNDVYDATNHSLNTGITFSGDIEIGAVELKDGTTDNRSTINAANTARNSSTNVLVTQNIDSGGNIGAVQGGMAHDAVDGGNPVKTGFKAVDPTSLPAAVSANDRTDAVGSLQGEALVYLSRYLAGENSSEGSVGVLSTAPQPVSTSTFASTKDVSSALEASKIVKASAGNLYRTFGVIDKTAPTGLYYVLHLDSSTLTADGAVTHLITPIPVNHTTGYDSAFDTGQFVYGTYATNGIVRVLSTTMVTKTIASAYMFATTSFK